MITVLGAAGFIGSHVVAALVEKNMDVYAPGRAEQLAGKKLGHVIYCIGLTADFRTRPLDTIEAHVCKLKELIQHCQMDSITYLSSTRLYIKSRSANPRLSEEDDIVLNPHDSADIFAASKMAGELMLLNSGLPYAKIVRVSNVFGNDFQSENFITAVLKDVLVSGKVELQTTKDSAKDYISIADTCEALIALAGKKTSGVYNLAYGSNTTNEAITNEIKKLTGAEIIYAPTAKKIVFQEIDNSKLVSETGFKPATSVIEGLPVIIDNFSKNL